MEDKKDEEKKPEEENKEEIKEPEKKEEVKVPIVDEANEAAKRIEEATAAQKIENDRADEITARKALGGTSEAGAIPPKPTKLTDTEYAEALDKGLVNPLKEDGII